MFSVSINIDLNGNRVIVNVMFGLSINIDLNGNEVIVEKMVRVFKVIDMFEAYIENICRVLINTDLDMNEVNVGMNGAIVEMMFRLQINIDLGV